MFFKISQNDIWKFGRNLRLIKFGSERVNRVSFMILFYNYYFGTLITGLFETGWMLFGGSTVFSF